MLCAMSAGATCVIPPHAKIAAAETAQMLMDSQRGINVFMAVPTISSCILAWFDTQPVSVHDAFKSSVSSRFRLMVSGCRCCVLFLSEGGCWRSSDPGPGVFREYWNRPVQTASEFDSDGWFKTGDG